MDINRKKDEDRHLKVGSVIDNAWWLLTAF